VKERHKPIGETLLICMLECFIVKIPPDMVMKFCIGGLMLPCEFGQSFGAYRWVQGILRKINLNYLLHVITKIQADKIPLSMGLQPSLHLCCCLAWFHVFVMGKRYCLRERG
jgi:hypothetical protein